MSQPQAETHWLANKGITLLKGTVRQKKKKKETVLCLRLFLSLSDKGWVNFFTEKKSDTYEIFVPIGDVGTLGYCCREEYIYFFIIFFFYSWELKDGIAT